jgi:hypothetical protein
LSFGLHPRLLTIAPPSLVATLAKEYHRVFARNNAFGLTPDAIQNLSYLKGGEVQQVCVGKFHLHPHGNISVWGRCELIDLDGRLADTWENGMRSDRFLFTDLLGGTVADVVIENTKTLRIQFADGRLLVIYDTSDQFESFSIDNMIV